MKWVSPRYFETVGLPVPRAGRSCRRTTPTPRVVVVNEAFAEHFLPDELAQQFRHRTREYGLRKALGAGIPDVIARTVRHGLEGESDGE